MRTINVFLSVLVSLAIGLLVFEAGLRLFPAYRPQETINEFDPVLGWSKRPDAEVERDTPELEVTFRTNAEGLRDDERPEKPANTFRVVMLGDSFTLGYTVDREDLFVDLVEGWWQEEQRRVEVINAGTEGWSTDQEVLWLRERGVDYEPDLVLLFPYENDIWWNGQTSYLRFPKPRFRPDGTLEERALEDPGQQPWWKDTSIGKLLGGRPAPRPEDMVEVPGASRPIFGEFTAVLSDPPAALDDAVARTKGALRALKATCDELGAKLVMVPIPPETLFDEKERERFGATRLAGLPPEAWSPDRPVDLFLEAGRELGITTIDPRPTLALHAQAGEELYFDDEWHFTPQGNRRFAELLITELDRLGAFPPEHEAIAPGAFPVPAEDDGGVPTWLVVFAVLWAFLGTSYAITYRDEPAPLAFVKVGALLAVIFALVLGGTALVDTLPPQLAPVALLLFVGLIVGFVVYKLGRRVGTICELLKAFTLRGHWYLMPLVVVLLTIGSLLVVAASSPLIAPFIYTLF